MLFMLFFVGVVSDGVSSDIRCDDFLGRYEVSEIYLNTVSQLLNHYH